MDISQSTHHLITSDVDAVRNNYAGVQATINAETTTDPYECPALLPENVATTSLPHPPGGGISWVVFMSITPTAHPALALTVRRPVYPLSALCGVRSSRLRAAVAGGPVDEPDRTGQDAGLPASRLM